MASCGRLFVFFLMAAALAMAPPAASMADVGLLRAGSRHLAAPAPAPTSMPQAASPAHHGARSPSTSPSAGATSPSSSRAARGLSHAPAPSASAGAAGTWSGRIAPAPWSPSYAPSQTPPQATDDGAKSQPPIGTTTPGQPAATGTPATTRPGASSGAVAGVPAAALTAAGLMAMMMLF